MMQKPMVVLCMLGQLAIPLNSTWACRCGVPPITRESLLQNDIVFTGEVIQVDLIENEWKRVAVFRVTQVWKGKVDRLVVVSTSLNSASCGYEFQNGEQYFVVAKDGVRYRYRTTLCVRNARLENADRLLEVLGEPIKVYVEGSEGTNERH